MPLGIRIRGPHSCPVVVCDHCGQVIEDARDGNYQWQGAMQEDEIALMVFTHKACCDPFEHAHRHEEPWCSIGLDALPHFLLHNLGLTGKESASVAARMTWV